MLKWIKYIMSAFLLFVVYTATGQDLHIENQLDKYEYLCGQCMDVKSKAASGETVSRNMAKSLIESFLAYNKILKNQEDEMTAAQRHRFAQIGRWFSTGVRPETFTAVPPVHAGVPYAPVAMLQSASCGIRPVSDTVFCDNSTCRSDLERVAYMQGGKPRGDIFILASIAAPDMAYGLMSGYKHRNWGGYLAFRSSFTSCKTSYSCASDGSMENGSKIWPTGNEKRSNLMVSGGVLAGATKWLTIYAGAGYGARKLAWEDVAGNWALVSDWSRSGFAAECGAVVSVRKLALSAGVSTVAFRTAAFTCGVGVKF
jgi:hypothetical protein